MITKTQHAYVYCVLRYVHDTRTRECLNVGVLYGVPELGLLEFRPAPSLIRIRKAFPDADIRGLEHVLQQLSHDAARLTKTFLPTESFGKVAERILARDDSALQWSEASGGQIDDPARLGQELIDRFVAGWTVRSKARRDEAIWKPVADVLQMEGVLTRASQVTLQTPLHRHRFDHGWKLEETEILKPVSLDIPEPDEFSDKVLRLGGVLQDLHRVSDPFRLHLIVGQPQEKNHLGLYADGLRFLRAQIDGNRVVLIEEDEASAFAHQFSGRVQRTLPVGLGAN